MARLAEVHARITSLGELSDVIGAMRSLAALRVDQGRIALPKVRKYSEMVDEALAQALSLTPADESRAAISREEIGAAVAFCAEHGFVGAFNERVLDLAQSELTGPRDSLLVIGSRGGVLAAERRLPIARTMPMATRGESVEGLAREIAREIYRRVEAGELHRVTLVYAASSGSKASEVTKSPLLPFTPGPQAREGADPRPLTNLAPRVLVERLIDELVFAQIARATMESFASENGARLAAMTAAHDSIEHKLEELLDDERRQRQEEITTELLDVVTGAEAMRKKP